MITLALPWPPTSNTYWRRPNKGALSGRTLISENGRAYRATVIREVMAARAKKQLSGLLSVEVLAFVPDRRRRDLDNLTKSLLDSITHAGVWLDDSQIDDLHIRRARDADGALVLGGRVEITIRAM